MRKGLEATSVEEEKFQQSIMESDVLPQTEIWPGARVFSFPSSSILFCFRLGTPM
jgi:hypothetical protein